MVQFVVISHRVSFLKEPAKDSSLRPEQAIDGCIFSGHYATQNFATGPAAIWSPQFAKSAENSVTQGNAVANYLHIARFDDKIVAAFP